MPAHPKADPSLLLVGEQIRRVRDAKGLSQEQFALESGMARGYYGGVERGTRNMSIRNLLRVAETLEVEVGELFPPLKEIRRTSGRKK